MHLTIGKVYDILEMDSKQYGIELSKLVKTDKVIDLMIPDRMIKGMFISLTDLRNEKIESIINV